jgi:hypothetical protein
MRRSFLTLAALAALGLLTTAGEASACHKKKCGCAAPVVCVPPPPVCAPVVCAPKVKHGHKLFAHKAKATCATPVAYTYAPTVWPSGQAPSGQMMH